jgi:hypothetical protein
LPFFGRLYNISCLSGCYAFGMLRSKTYIKKNRKGGIVKVVQDYYLRDDVWCGSEACLVCPKNAAVLEMAPRGPNPWLLVVHAIYFPTRISLFVISPYLLTLLLKT